MTEAAVFRISAEGYWVLIRLLCGFVTTMLAAFGLAHPELVVVAGSLLVLCVWLDAGTGWFFRKRGLKEAGTIALETYADVICFVVAPLGLAAALANSFLPYILFPIFLVAAVYRLARFQVQGLVRKGYVGLPVTYNGYLFPLAGLAIHFFSSAADIILIVLLIGTSVCMVSNRFVVPEF